MIQASEALPEVAVEAFQSILASAHLLSTQVSNILDASIASEITPCLELYPVQSKIAECLNFHRTIAAEKKVEFDVHARSLPPVFCDHVKIVQILTNLLTNAIRYSREQSVVSVEVSLSEIMDNSRVSEKPTKEFEKHGETNVLRVRVTDSGTGIPDHKKRVLFSQSCTTERRFSEVRKTEGTGLGLFVSKVLCEAMGGCIWLEASRPNGSTFCFEVPVIVPFASKIAFPASRRYSVKEAITRLVTSEEWPKCKLQILVADDSVINRKVLLKLLSAFGLSADICSDGLQAVEAVRTKRYDIIFMDVRMPKMNGDEASKIIFDELSLKYGIQTPSVLATNFANISQLRHQFPLIVSVTANTSAADLARYKKCKMGVHISKPLTLEVLYDFFSIYINLGVDKYQPELGDVNRPSTPQSICV
jgi:CheY-like chemotaxis protein